MIKQAKGVGFSLLGFGRSKPTWHSFIEEEFINSFTGEDKHLVDIIYLMSHLPSPATFLVTPNPALPEQRVNGEKILRNVATK